MNDLQKMLNDLRKPFHPSAIEWKPGMIKGERAMAMPYADLRTYMNRLDEVCGPDWSVAYEPWGADRIICKLTIGGVTRASTGEMGAQDEKNEMGGTVAEAQAMKRACAMFGLGRYLYNLPTGWADIDPQTKRFTDKAKAKLVGIVMQHYRRATGGDEGVQNGTQPTQTAQDEAEGTPPHNHFWGVGLSVFGKADWDMARPWLLKKWTEKVTPDNVRSSSSDLSDDEKTMLAEYMQESASALQKVWPKQKALIEKQPA